MVIVRGKRGVGWRMGMRRALVMGVSEEVSRQKWGSITITRTFQEIFKHFTILTWSLRSSGRLDAQHKQRGVSGVRYGRTFSGEQFAAGVHEVGEEQGLRGHVEG